MAFRDVRNILLLSHDDGTINDEEFLVLHDFYCSKNADFPYDSYMPFDLEELDESECLAEFRFRKRDIPRLCTMFCKFPTLLPVISAWCAMELKAFVCYLSACHIHADMEI